VTASNPAERVVELSAQIVAYQSEQTASTDPIIKAICGDIIQQNTKEKAYQSGAGSFPNPFNPPGQSNRK
jgi:hypothetical protein